MIRWILFDQARVQTAAVFSNKESYYINGKTIASKELILIFKLPEYHEYDIGKIAESELIKIYLEKFHPPLSTEEFKLLFKEGIVPVEGMKEILEKLYPNYNLASLINEGKEWTDYKFEKSGFKRFFKHIIVSGEIGLKKPQPEFFLAALKIINAVPKECLFIDDHLENCQAAQKLGIRSICFKNSEQLKEELKKLEIKI